VLSRGAVETLSKTSDPRSLRRARRLGLELGCAIIVMLLPLLPSISELVDVNVDTVSSSRASKVNPTAKTLHGPFMTGYVLAGCGG